MKKEAVRDTGKKKWSYGIAGVLMLFVFYLVRTT
jgi:hypothetical protein